MTDTLNIDVPTIDDMELAKRLANLKILVLDRPDQDFLWLGLGTAEQKTVELTKKTVYQYILSESMTYAYRWDKNAMPEHTQAVKRTIYTLRSAAGHFALTLEEVLAQIPDELLDKKVFAIVLDSCFDLAPGGDFYQLEATYLVK